MSSVTVMLQRSLAWSLYLVQFAPFLWYLLCGGLLVRKVKGDGEVVASAQLVADDSGDLLLNVFCCHSEVLG